MCLVQHLALASSSLWCDGLIWWLCNESCKISYHISFVFRIRSHVTCLISIFWNLAIWIFFLQYLMNLGHFFHEKSFVEVEAIFFRSNFDEMLREIFLDLHTFPIWSYGRFFPQPHMVQHVGIGERALFFLLYIAKKLY